MYYIAYKAYKIKRVHKLYLSRKFCWIRNIEKNCNFELFMNSLN